MTTKTVYSFDPNTLAYLGSLLLDEGDLSPLDLAEGREVWCLPGNTVEVPPPENVPAGKYAAAVNGAWEIRDVPVPVGVKATAAAVGQHRALEPMEAAAMLHATVQRHLDAVARTQRFNGIDEAATYVSSRVTNYMAQATELIVMRDKTWAMVEPIIDDVAAGIIAAPKFAELVLKLPVYDAIAAEKMIAAVEAEEASAAAAKAAADAAEAAEAVAVTATVRQRAKKAR